MGNFLCSNNKSIEFENVYVINNNNLNPMSNENIVREILMFNKIKYKQIHSIQMASTNTMFKLDDFKKKYPILDKNTLVVSIGDLKMGKDSMSYSEILWINNKLQEKRSEFENESTRSKSFNKCLKSLFNLK